MKSLTRVGLRCCAGLAALGLGPLLAQDPGSTFEARQLDPEHGKVQVFDVDQDGRNDVMKIQSQGESLAWYQFRPGGAFAKHVVFRDRRFRADRMGVADLDGDGDLDVVTGLEEDGPRVVIWLENPLPQGKPADLGAWKIHTVGPQSDYIKDIGIADFNRDGKLDIVTRTHTQTAIFFQKSPVQWAPPKLLHHESHEGMDVADLDRDGDVDIITCEHSMPLGKTPAPGHERLQIWVNDGKGNFAAKTIDRNKESHLGARVVDLDRDGDLDIVSIAWRDYQYLHLWRNDAIAKE